VSRSLARCVRPSSTAGRRLAAASIEHGIGRNQWLRGHSGPKGHESWVGQAAEERDAISQPRRAPGPPGPLEAGSVLCSRWRWDVVSPPNEVVSFCWESPALLTLCNAGRRFFSEPRRSLVALPLARRLEVGSAARRHWLPAHATVSRPPSRVLGALPCPRRHPLELPSRKWDDFDASGRQEDGVPTPCSASSRDRMEDWCLVGRGVFPELTTGQVSSAEAQTYVQHSISSVFTTGHVCRYSTVAWQLRYLEHQLGRSSLEKLDFKLGSSSATSPVTSLVVLARLGDLHDRTHLYSGSAFPVVLQIALAAEMTRRSRRANQSAPAAAAISRDPRSRWLSHAAQRRVPTHQIRPLQKVHPSIGKGKPTEHRLSQAAHGSKVEKS